MKFVTLSTDKAKRLFFGVALGTAALVITTTSQRDPIVMAGAITLMLLSLFPLYLWVVGSSHGLPIWPAFAAYTGITSALPVVQSSISLLNYSSLAIFTGLVTIAAFLLIGTVAWLASTSRAPKPPRTVLMLASKTTIRSLLLCLGIGLLFNANAVAGWFNFPGNTMQVARGIAGGLGFFGCFSLAYLHGSGHLQRSVIVAYVTMIFLLVAFALTSLMLANAIAPVSLALIGFTLGAGRVPWKTLLLMFVVMAVLHPGKFVMRQIYEENPQNRASLGILQMPAFYSEWVSYGFESLGGVSGVFRTAASQDDTAPSTVFDRAGTLHMLLLVQQKSPDQVPFLDGMTYAPIPYLFLPRFLAPDKGVSHAGNIILSVNYGLLEAGTVHNVSIGWNLVAEAYANFGYAGVFVLAALLGLLYGMVSRLTAGVPLTSFRFVSGLIVLAGVTNDNSLGVFLTMQFQGVIGVALASIFLMRRQPNPFAAEGGGEGRPHEAQGVRHTAKGPKDERTNRPIDEETVGGRRLESGERQVAADGGVVRNVITRVPQRAAAWMPRRMRKQLLVAQTAANGEEEGERESPEDQESKRPKDGRERPRQLAVPFQNYRRYRG